MIEHIIAAITVVGIIGLIIHFTIQKQKPLYLILAWLMALLPITIMLTLKLLIK